MFYGAILGEICIRPYGPYMGQDLLCLRPNQHDWDS